MQIILDGFYFIFIKYLNMLDIKYELVFEKIVE